MLAYIKGKIAELSPTQIIVENFGLGYSLQISLHTYKQLKGQEEVKLLIYEHIRENQHDLYGFSEAIELRVFMALIKVQGISTQTARTMLSCYSPLELTEAIENADRKLLESIKGIGRKSAERIIVELKENIVKLVDGQEGSSNKFNRQEHNLIEQEAIQALQTLGINRNMALAAIKKVQQLPNPPQELEKIIVAALQFSR